MNAERDTALVALRPRTPAIDLAVQALTTSATSIVSENGLPTPLEYFLHSTLRAILKLQHTTLLRVVALHLSPHRGTLLQLSHEAQGEFFANALKKDVSLRMLIIGIVVGHFTDAELERYADNSDDKAEIHKRIIELAARRVGDARAEVIAML